MGAEQADEQSLRYREEGQVHLDFHRTLNATIAYLRTTYGQDFLDETFRRTAHDVYRSICEDLARGDTGQLIAHWTYYLDREGGAYELVRDGDELRMTVTRCPAVAWLKHRGIAVDPAFRRQTSVTNEALAEGTPFTITTEDLGEGQYVQTIRRKPA